MPGEPRQHPDAHLLAKLLERIELAQEASGIGIHDYDIVNNRIEWDSRVRAMWGVSATAEIRYKDFITGIHPDDRAASEAAIVKSLDPKGDGHYRIEYRVCNANDSSIRTVQAIGRVSFAGGTPLRMIGTVRDVTEERAAKVFSDNLIATVPAIVYIYDLVERRNVFIGPQIVAMTGYGTRHYRDIDSSLIATIAHPEDVERIADHHRAIRRGTAEPPFEIEYRMRNAAGGWMWLASTEIVHSYDEAGKPREILGAAIDISRRREAEQARDMLIGELGHRVKNTLALVQSMAAMTLRKSCTEDAWEEFELRLQALGQAQTALNAGDWNGAALLDLVQAAVKPFDGGEGNRIAIDGPGVTVSSQLAMPLSLALHELATNATKYGALKDRTGTVAISWQDSEGMVVLHWEERGGPPVVKPSRTGFGSQLIRRSLGKSGGSGTIDFAATGVVCELRFPATLD